MKVIVAGSRSITDLETVAAAIEESGFEITEVVSGTARGVDVLGEQWAEQNDIPVKRFPANWNYYGKSAGPVRNGAMADYADGLVAAWDTESNGTRNMIKQANDRDLKVYIKAVNPISSLFDDE